MPFLYSHPTSFLLGWLRIGGVLVLYYLRGMKTLSILLTILLLGCSIEAVNVEEQSIDSLRIESADSLLGPPGDPGDPGDNPFIGDTIERPEYPLPPDPPPTPPGNPGPNPFQPPEPPNNGEVPGDSIG